MNVRLFLRATARVARNHKCIPIGLVILVIGFAVGEYGLFMPLDYTVYMGISPLLLLFVGMTLLLQGMIGFLK